MQWGWYLLPVVVVLAIVLNLVEAGTGIACKLMRRSPNERTRQWADRLQDWRERNVVVNRDD